MHASAKRAHARSECAAGSHSPKSFRGPEFAFVCELGSVARSQRITGSGPQSDVKDIAASRAWSSEMMSEPVKKSRLRSSGTRGWPTSCWRTCSARDRQSAWQIASTARLQRFALVGPKLGV